MRILPLLLAPLALAACDSPADDSLAEPPPAPAPSGPAASASPAPAVVPSPASPSETPTTAPRAAGPTIHDPAMAQRLRANKGLTLQWIDWDRRGTAQVSVQPDGAWRLTGSQQARTGDGRLALDGMVTEVGADYFLFDGTIKITDAPDPGRACSADKVWRFAITQDRPYWRLREFEWCDGLTDYVDIYF